MEESLEDDIKKIYKERMVSEIDEKLRELRYIPPNTRYNYDLESVSPKELKIRALEKYRASLLTDSEIIRELVDSKKNEDYKTLEEEINSNFTISFPFLFSHIEREFANRGLIKHLTSEEKERFAFLIQKIENPQKLKKILDDKYEIWDRKVKEWQRKKDFKASYIAISIIIFIIYILYII